jgi:hypothetical protein
MAKFSKRMYEGVAGVLGECFANPANDNETLIAVMEEFKLVFAADNSRFNMCRFEEDIASIANVAQQVRHHHPGN